MSNVIYCTYLTIYKGNKLPPFYIGSTSALKISEGYRGSVQSKKYKQIWLSELKDNPHLFETQILTTHTTREEALNREESFQKKMNVVNNPLYINLCIAGKLFSDNTGRKRTEQMRLNISMNHGKGMLGRKHSEKTKTQMSKNSYHRGRFGSNSPIYGRKHSDESKRKMSFKNKGKKRTVEQSIRQSERQKGRAAPNKGIPHTEECKRKISLKAKNRPKRKWITNNIIEQLISKDDKIPENYTNGRLKKR